MCVYLRIFILIMVAPLSQVQWLIKLSQVPGVEEVPSFSNNARYFLQGIVDGFTIDDALEIKEIERVTNHDVKAVEYFLKQKCQSHSEIVNVWKRLLDSRDNELTFFFKDFDFENFENLSNDSNH